MIVMKTYPLILVALLTACACQSQPFMPPPPRPEAMAPVLVSPGAPPAAEPVKDLVNFLIHVEWQEPKGDPKFLEVLTAEGTFDLNTIQKNSMKINNNDVPVTLKFQGTLKELSDTKGRLQLFLGRTVPYVTSSGPGAISSYSQMSVGLDSTFIVTFGKPAVIQTDENGQITVLVKRVEN